jgi:hypothetical protein
MKVNQVTTLAPHDGGFTSSQTDSTFQASEADNSASESERPAGDRPEITVKILQDVPWNSVSQKPERHSFCGFT